MKKIFILIITLYSQTLFAQIISLEDAFNYRINDQPYPAGTNYVKDINNRLDSFVGTWKGNDNGRLYEVRFNKKLAYSMPGGEVAWDRLVGRILVKDSISNDTIYTTLDIQDDYQVLFWGLTYNGSKLYNLSFSGPENGCYDFGDVYIILADNDATLMAMHYYRGDGDLIDPRTCLGGYENYRAILPKTLYLRKQ